MPIYRLLQNATFGPEAIRPIVAAYEEAMSILKVTDRNNPITATVAKRIFEIAQTGERDSARLRTQAFSSLGISDPVPALGISDLDQSPGIAPSDNINMEWKPIAAAPFDCDLELAVIEYDGTHALVFPCRRLLHGWLNAQTKKPIYDLRPTHWRYWPGST